MTSEAAVAAESSNDALELVEGLQRCCAYRWSATPTRWRQVSIQQRAYSTIRVIQVQIGDRTRWMVVKSVVSHDDNLELECGGAGVKREFHMLQAAEAALKEAPDCSVPHPYFVDDATGLLFLELVPGTNLDRRLIAARRTASRQSRAATERDYHRLGRWLALFQQGQVPGQMVLGDWRQQWWQQCGRRLERIVDHAHVSLPVDFGPHLQLRLRGLAEQLPAHVRIVPAHGDFGPWNVLVIDDRLTVLDFFAARPDLPWADVANVVTYLQLQSYSQRLSRSVIGHWLRAFEEGYANSEGPRDPSFHAQILAHWLCRIDDLVTKPCHTWAARWSRKTLLRGALNEWQLALDRAARA